MGLKTSNNTNLFDKKQLCGKTKNIICIEPKKEQKCLFYSVIYVDLKVLMSKPHIVE